MYGGQNVHFLSGNEMGFTCGRNNVWIMWFECSLFFTLWERDGFYLLLHEKKLPWAISFRVTIGKTHLVPANWSQCFILYLCESIIVFELQVNPSLSFFQRIPLVHCARLDQIFQWYFYLPHIIIRRGIIIIPHLQMKNSRRFRDLTTQIKSQIWRTIEACRSIQGWVSWTRSRLRLHLLHISICSMDHWFLNNPWREFHPLPILERNENVDRGGTF